MQKKRAYAAFNVHYKITATRKVDIKKVKQLIYSLVYLLSVCLLQKKKKKIRSLPQPNLSTVMVYLKKFSPIIGETESYHCN
jgi:hypothetical protein